MLPSASVTWSGVMPEPASDTPYRMPSSVLLTTVPPISTASPVKEIARSAERGLGGWSRTSASGGLNGLSVMDVWIGG